MEQKTKQVGIYTVSSWSTLCGVRARTFHEQIAPLVRDGELSEEDEIYNVWLDNWLAIASVTQPKITLDDFAAMPPDLYTELMQAADEVNNEFAEFARQPQSKKKKPRQPKQSTSDLTK